MRNPNKHVSKLLNNGLSNLSQYLAKDWALGTRPWAPTMASLDEIVRCHKAEGGTAKDRGPNAFLAFVHSCLPASCCIQWREKPLKTLQVGWWSALQEGAWASGEHVQVGKNRKMVKKGLGTHWSKKRGPHGGLNTGPLHIAEPYKWSALPLSYRGGLMPGTTNVSLIIIPTERAVCPLKGA